MLVFSVSLCTKLSLFNISYLPLCGAEVGGGNHGGHFVSRNPRLQGRLEGGERKQ